MKKIIILIFIIVAFFSITTSADRGSIPFIAGIDIFEPNQDALIAWNGEEEILILSTKLYASEPTKVLQVLPLPSEPIVKKSSRDVLKRANEFIFKDLFNELRQPVLRSSEAEIPAAEIKEEVVIGSHDILVVEVLNQDYFVNWVNDYLKSRGQNNPQIPAQLTRTINNYINRGYNYFVFDTIEVGPEPKLNQAISYVFESKELYYPLEITKSDHGVSEIHQILVVDGTVFTSDVREVIAFTIGASRICEHDDVAFTRPILHLMVKDGSIDRFRSAVDIKYGRILLFRVVVFGKQHKAFDFMVLFFNNHGLRFRGIRVREHEVIEGTSFTR